MPRTRGKAGSSPGSVALSPTLACVGWTRTSFRELRRAVGPGCSVVLGPPWAPGLEGPLPVLRAPTGPDSGGERSHRAVGPAESGCVYTEADSLLPVAGRLLNMMPVRFSL